MAERIENPPILQGDERTQLETIWRYLNRLAEDININLDAIGGNELTDSERVSMSQILQAAGVEDAEQAASQPMETLKSLIIKTAEFVQTSIQEYRTTLYGETIANSQFGQVSMHRGLDVVVNPEGVLQNYSLRTIVQDLKRYEVNAKNYIKCGLLRTVDNIPVYGVAIGKDVVTMDENGVETYHDGNKVAELTADELSFYQNGAKIAGYTGSRISFYYNGAETFYIQNGEIHALADLILGAGKKVKIGDWTFEGQKLTYKNENEDIGFTIKKSGVSSSGDAGISYRYSTEGDHPYGEIWISVAREEMVDDELEIKYGHFIFGVVKLNGSYIKYFAPYIDQNNYTPAYLGLFTRPFHTGIINTIYADAVLPNPDGSSKTIGGSTNPFSSVISNNIRANYIYPDSNGSLKQIGSSQNPFSNIYGDNIRADNLFGILQGGIKPKYDSTIGDFDDMKSNGMWWVSASAMQHRPSDISTGTLIVEVFNITDNLVFQRITKEDAIYTRMYTSNGWGSWYKYAGTAV